VPDKEKRKSPKLAQSGGAQKRTVIRGTSSQKNTSSQMTVGKIIHRRQNSGRDNSISDNSGHPHSTHSHVADSHVVHSRAHNNAQDLAPSIGGAEVTLWKSRINSDFLRKATS